MVVQTCVTLTKNDMAERAKMVGEIAARENGGTACVCERWSSADNGYNTSTNPPLLTFNAFTEYVMEKVHALVSWIQRCTLRIKVF